MLEDGPGRFDDRILVILLEQVDRPLVREQRALLDEPEPGAAGMADDLENIGNALDRAAVHELFERESVLARAGEQRDDLSALRSEEHTSELQSLMRISYAVFCLKKQKYM